MKKLIETAVQNLREAFDPGGEWRYESEFSLVAALGFLIVKGSGQPDEAPDLLDICAEKKYPKNPELQDAYCDLVIRDGNDEHWIEVKYYRKLNGKVNGKTAHVGQLASDLIRLSSLKRPSEKTFRYMLVCIHGEASQYFTYWDERDWIQNLVRKKDQFTIQIPVKSIRDAGTTNESRLLGMGDDQSISLAHLAESTIGDHSVILLEVL